MTEPKENENKAVDYNEEIERVRQAWNEAHPSTPAVPTVSSSYSWVERVRDDSIIVEFDNSLYEVAYTDGDDGIEFVTPDEWVKVERVQEYKPIGTNALKAVSSTDDELRAANYIIMFGSDEDRDLEGILTPRANADGSAGEYFTKATQLESAYTEMGRLPINWEHGIKPDGKDIEQPGRDDVLGYVDWKSARVDDKGVWVERVLRRHNVYMQYLEILIDQGIIGTSSEAATGAKSTAGGEVTAWPLSGDALTVMPTEWRQKWGNENVLQAMKGLADLDTAFKALLPDDETPEPEPSTGDAGASRAAELAAKSGRVKAEQLLIKIERMR